MISIYSPTPGSWDWAWASLAGPDALDFLHRVTTVNTRSMAIGEGMPGCFLTAQGKLRGIFTLWNYGEGEYGFEFDPGVSGKWRDSLFAAIDQYTFAEKMTLTSVSGLECRWIFCEADQEKTLLQAMDPNGSYALPAGHTRAIDEEIRFCNHGSKDFGKVWVTVWGRPARLAQWIERVVPSAQPVSAETLDSWRIHATRPRVDHELTDATVPLEVGLVDSIAPNKGCYPGQEVIEKIVSLGSPAKRLGRISGEGPAPALGEPVLNDASPAAEVGTVTSVFAKPEGGFEALALLRKNYAKEGLETRFKNAAARGKIASIAPYENPNP